MPDDRPPLDSFLKKDRPPLESFMQSPAQSGQQTSQLQKLTEAPLIQKGKDLLSQREQDIDYSAGAPVSTRVMLQKASNPEEARRTLERTYGVGNYGQDKFGQWWIKQGDKKVSVLPKGISGGLKNVGTGMVASSWPMMGAVGGGVVGEILEPFGGGIPGAMVGAAVGKGIDDLIKWTQGIFAQSPKETVSGLANEAALAGAFQGAGPIMQRAGQGLKGALQSFTGTTPTTRVTAQALSSGGAVPPIGSFAPEATSAEYKRQLRNMLAGNPAEAKNVEYLTSQMDRVLKNEGVPAPQRQTLIQEIYDTSARTSTREAGEKLAGKASEINRNLWNDYTSARNRVEQQLNQAEKVLRQAALAPASTAKDVSVGIVNAKREFSKAMNDVYEKVDNMTGDQAVVPTAAIKEQAKDLVNIMPPNALPPLINTWASDKAPKAINFAQAHALRTTFREMGEITDVSPIGQKIGNVRKLAGAVDAAINSTGDQLGQQAAKALKAADTQYARGIAKFNANAINHVVRELRSGIVPEPGYVARLIMNEENPNLAKTVFTMLPDSVKENVIKADLGNMISAASKRGANGEQRLDGASFLQILDQRSPLLNAVYDPKVTAALKSHARDLAAFDGKVDVTNLKTPTAITYAIERAVGAARAADEFVKNNPLGALVNGTPIQVDRALARLTRAGEEAVTERAVKTLGVDSPEWRAVRKYALQRLFSGSVVEKQSLAKTISGEDITKSLNKYTKRQQDLLFPGGLADDLRLLAQEAKFLFPSMNPKEEMGTSMAAAAIKGGLWLNPLAVYKYIRLNIVGYIADHPAVLRLLTSEIRRDRVQARSLMGVMGQWLTERALEGGPGRGQPPAPPPEPQRERPGKSDLLQRAYGGTQ